MCERVSFPDAKKRIRTIWMWWWGLLKRWSLILLGKWKSFPFPCGATYWCSEVIFFDPSLLATPYSFLFIPYTILKTQTASLLVRLRLFLKEANKFSTGKLLLTWYTNNSLLFILQRLCVCDCLVPLAPVTRNYLPRDISSIPLHR